MLLVFDYLIKISIRFMRAESFDVIKKMADELIDNFQINCFEISIDPTNSHQ